MPSSIPWRSAVHNLERGVEVGRSLESGQVCYVVAPSERDAKAVRPAVTGIRSTSHDLSYRGRKSRSLVEQRHVRVRTRARPAPSSSKLRCSCMTVLAKRAESTCAKHCDTSSAHLSCASSCPIASSDSCLLLDTTPLILTRARTVFAPADEKNRPLLTASAIRQRPPNASCRDDRFRDIRSSAATTR